MWIASRGLRRRSSKKGKKRGLRHVDCGAAVMRHSRHYYGAIRAVLCDPRKITTKIQLNTKGYSSKSDKKIRKENLNLQHFMQIPCKIENNVELPKKTIRFKDLLFQNMLASWNKLTDDGIDV